MIQCCVMHLHLCLKKIDFLWKNVYWFFIWEINTLEKAPLILSHVHTSQTRLSNPPSHHWHWKEDAVHSHCSVIWTASEQLLVFLSPVCIHCLLVINDHMGEIHLLPQFVPEHYHLFQNMNWMEGLCLLGGQLYTTHNHYHESFLMSLVLSAIMQWIQMGWDY